MSDQATTAAAAAGKRAKKPRLPEGIIMKRTPRGINVTVSENGRILCVLRGYNTERSAQKGLGAVHSALQKALGADGRYRVAEFRGPAKGSSRPAR